MAVSPVFDGIVKEKLTDPLRLKVSEGNYYAAVDCLTDVGTWGAARVGDLVRVRRMGPVNVAEPPFDLNGRSNTLQRVGEDLALGSTNSVSTYVTLLDATGLYIGPTSAFEVYWTIQAQAVGTPGAADKELRLVLNDEAGIDLSFISGTLVTTGERAFISPLAEDFPTPLRFVGGQVGQWVYTSLEGEINRVRVQARSNDTAGTGGQDIVRGQGLAVFA